MGSPTFHREGTKGRRRKERFKPRGTRGARGKEKETQRTCNRGCTRIHADRRGDPQMAPATCRSPKNPETRRHFFLIHRFHRLHGLEKKKRKRVEPQTLLHKKNGQALSTDFTDSHRLFFFFFISSASIRVNLRLRYSFSYPSLSFVFNPCNS